MNLPLVLLLYVAQGASSSWPDEQTLREMAVRLYREQPIEPQTSMDKDFKHQMTKPGERALPQSASNAPRPLDGGGTASPPLSFVPVWGVLDMAAKGSGLKAIPANLRVGMAEASLMVAVARQAWQAPPTICLSGFGTGHGAIVWLESAAGARVLALDPFAEQHQRGSNAFLQSLYKGKFIPIPGPPLKSLRELGASGLPIACDVVHLDLDPDQRESVGLELLAALGPLASGVKAVVLTGAVADDEGLPARLWKAAQQRGLLGEGGCHGGGDRALCAGVYAPRAAAAK